ncbi:MAG: phage integrase SAM-like domain-containing protein [Nitrospirae bacterium]|jgi:hypothetical protein|nr:phage integrase SAM-like domain-containing protein [Nitrospirota bacterium]
MKKNRDVHTVKVLLPVFGDLKLSEITTEMIADYRTGLLRTVKPATVYQELSLMRRMFNVACKDWILNKLSQNYHNRGILEEKNAGQNA